MDHPTFPFECAECQAQPADQFGVFAPTNDWLMAFPDQNLIHIHLGQSVIDDHISLAEAKYQHDWVMALLARFPEKKFFYIIDMSHKDDRELMPAEAREILKKLMTHPQLPRGAAYGLTWAWRMFGGIMNILGGHVSLEVTKEAADKKYLQWQANQN